MSQSKISRLERGKILPTVADVERILKALEVPREVSEELVALARRANVEHVSVRVLAAKGIWRAQTEIKALAETCTVQRSFLPTMVSGLLQVPEYARAALSPSTSSEPARDIEKAVAARLDGQAVLDDPKRQFFFLMTEQAVRWRWVDRPVMARQCEHIADVAERPNVDVAIIPLSAQVREAPLSDFLTFDDRLVIVELFTGMVFFRDYKDVKYYLELFEFFRGHALTGDRARAFLLSARDEFM
jgi:transcriptional regulator with XRE-family HTH domain